MAKPREHKKQHYIPATYLRAWCDPETPERHEPYAWLFPRDGGVGKPKAPTSIFHETEFYTLAAPDGQRDLTLETGLAELESRFASIRRRILADDRPLADDQKFLLCAFTAAMQARTLTQRDHQRDQFGRVLEKMRMVKDSVRRATPEQLEAMSMIAGSHDEGESITMAEVEAIVRHPTQTLLPTTVEVHASILYAMDLAVLCTSSSPGFITSDNPYAIIDPGLRDLPRFWRSAGLGSRTVEVTLSVSPSQVLFFNNAGIRGYLPAPDRTVLAINRRTRAFAKACVVVQKNHFDRRWL